MSDNKKLNYDIILNILKYAIFPLNLLNCENFDKLEYFSLTEPDFTRDKNIISDKYIANIDQLIYHLKNMRNGYLLNETPDLILKEKIIYLGNPIIHFDTGFREPENEDIVLIAFSYMKKCSFYVLFVNKENKEVTRIFPVVPKKRNNFSDLKIKNYIFYHKDNERAYLIDKEMYVRTVNEKIDRREPLLYNVRMPGGEKIAHITSHPNVKL